MSFRIALCVGVASYRATKLRLPNPANDAQCVDRALKARGFDSTLLLNPTTEEFTRALDDLKDKIAGNAGHRGFGMVFYAGHAIELGGFGVVMPADTPYPVRPALMANFCVSALEIVDALKMVQGPKVVVIDACRNSVADWNATQVLDFNEWTKIETERLDGAAKAENVAIAYSTAAGQEAFDGTGGNSLYCEKLEAALLHHNVSIIEALTQCGQQVIADTRAKQQPWVYTNMSMKAGFSDLPSYALVSSVTLDSERAANTRLHVRAMDDAIAVNAEGRVQFVCNGVEKNRITHKKSLTAAAVWEDYVLLAGPDTLVSLKASESDQGGELNPTIMKTKCAEPHGIAIAPDGAFAIVYGRGYSVLERTKKGWGLRSSGKRSLEVYGAVFQSDRIGYLCGPGNFVLRLRLDSGKPQVDKIFLNDHLIMYDLTWIADRGMIAGVCAGGKVAWIDPANGNVDLRKMFFWPSVDVSGAYGRLRRMDFSSEEANIYILDPERFEVEHGPGIWHRTNHQRRPDYNLLCCDLTADPRVLAIGAEDGLIFLIDVRTKEHFATLDVGNQIGVRLQWIACTADGAVHALGYDGIVRCFEPIPPLA